MTAPQQWQQPPQPKQHSRKWSTKGRSTVRTRTIFAAATAALALASLTACGSQTIADEAAPASEETAMHGPLEGPIEEGAGAPIEEDEGAPVGNDTDTLAVAGKQAVTYDDGLVISVGNLKRGRVPDYNDHPGEPMVRFDVRIKNGSALRMSGDSATVSLSYGVDGREADSVYLENSEGLTGTIAKGRNKTGTYAFEVPAKHMQNLVIEVAPDYEHDPALFEAAVR